MGAKQAVINFPFSHLGDWKDAGVTTATWSWTHWRQYRWLWTTRGCQECWSFPCSISQFFTTFTWFIHLSMESNRCLQVAQVTLLVTPQLLVITLLQHCLPISKSEPDKNSFFFFFCTEALSRCWTQVFNTVKFNFHIYMVVSLCLLVGILLWLSAGYFDTAVGGDKWLSLWVSHWFDSIHSSRLIHSGTKTWVIESFTQPICSKTLIHWEAEHYYCVLLGEAQWFCFDCFGTITWNYWLYCV